LAQVIESTSERWRRGFELAAVGGKYWPVDVVLSIGDLGALSRGYVVKRQHVVFVPPYPHNLQPTPKSVNLDA
jgi:hypothetical protein